jgi:two-component system chemotaxis sensor kinase CheA
VFRLVDLSGHGQVSFAAPEALLLAIRAGAETVALEVDRVEDRIEAVVRPPSGLVGSLPGVAGTTLLGNGRVLLVLDPASTLAGEPTVDRMAREQR